MAKRVIRPPRTERAGGLPWWLKLLGGVLVTLVAAHFYLIHQINQFADNLVQAAGLFSTASHRGGYYTWDGNLGIRRLRFEAADGGNTLLNMSELELDTPGWWWVLQLANPLEDRSQRVSRAMRGIGGGERGGSLLPTADELHLRLLGFELEVNDATPPGLPDIGFSSGALFETEGCTNVRYLVPLNLQRDLGLDYHEAELSVGYRGVAADQVLVEFEFKVPGVSTSRFEMDWKTPQPRRFLEGNAADESLLAMRWIMQDQGFVKARNRWCAAQAQVDADEFQRRHITTVRRVLEVFGVRLSPETEAVYSTFASRGGTLTIESRPSTSLSGPQFQQYSAPERWQALNVQIWHNQSPKVPMGVELVPARPLPKAYSGSVYDLLARNADSGSSSGASPLVALGEQMRGLTQPSAQPEAQATPAARTESEPTPTPTRAAPQPINIGLDSPSLIAAIGEWVSIETDDGRHRTGTLARVEPKVITIEVNVNGGRAHLDFSRDRITAVVANPSRR
jgi:hypothetical protein